MSLPSKNLIAEAIRISIGSLPNIGKIIPVSGGSISTSYRIDTEKESFFIKLNRADTYPMFVSEAEGLTALSQCTDIRTPRVLGLGEIENYAFLLQEYISLTPLKGEERSFEAGKSLAALHQITGKAFGWIHSNFIGNHIQSNCFDEDWASFFARERISPQLELIEERDSSIELLKEGERLLNKIDDLLWDHKPAISLIHGDLWSGNAGLDQTGKLVLFDPAVHYADRESDLAMTELFGGFSPAFYQGYKAAWPLKEGYPQRKKLYQLYHVLNHFNLFGGSYQYEAEGLIGDLLAI